MNIESTQPHDAWQALLGQASPTFATGTEPPFGFVTSTLARLRAENRDKELMERIGLRALFASLAVLVAVGFFTLDVRTGDTLDLEPGLRAAVAAEDAPLA